ncbi:hypothetical protein K3M35_10375, partial [Rhodococcus sp. DMU2021]|nr:hypothetical protein [Rhodococcus sp. DMU2021]
MLVLEPIFEADFTPVSYDFRPRRRAQDAIAEMHAWGTRNHHWVFEADIAACFDELDHSAIVEQVRTRIVDKRVRSSPVRWCTTSSRDSSSVDQAVKAGVTSSVPSVTLSAGLS